MYTLRELRMQSGLTQEELADAFGITARTIQNLEKDSSGIREPVLSKYINGFGVSYDDIFLGTEYEIFELQKRKKDDVLHRIKTTSQGGQTIEEKSSGDL